MILDTGSADFWVASIDCKGCPFPESLYDFRKSSTFTEVVNGPLVTIKYTTPDDAVSGAIIGSDMVSLGGASEPFNGFELVNQHFRGSTIIYTYRSRPLTSYRWSTQSVLADKVFFDLHVSEAIPIQGVMGLALSGLSVTQSLSFFQDLTAEDENFELPGFSFWIQRTTDTQGPQQFGPGGVFTIGGANPSFFTGEIEFLDIPSIPGQDEPTLWALNVAHVLVNGKNIPINTTGGAAIAAFDTGTKLIGAPFAAASAIWKAAGGKELTDLEDSGLFEIRKPYITFLVWYVLTVPL